MNQAATIVTSGSIVNELMNAHGGNGAYGIYTPFYEGAAALEAAIGGFEGKEEIHGNTPNANPGQYFWHFHNASHDYHIWFGAPMNVGVG